MKFLVGVVIVTVCVAAGALAASCGDDGGSAPATATVSAEQASVTAVVSRLTPPPAPTVVGNQVTSDKGYSATFPPGWNVRPNLVQTSDASVDGFFEPLKPGARAQASILVNCIAIQAESPEAHVEFAATNTARIGLNHDITMSETTVAGRPATVLAYRFQAQNNPNTPQLDKQDILFSDDRCDWIITTTAILGERPQYQENFDAFVQSFTLAP